MIDLSIIIVSWNTRELLDKCLRSIYRNLAGYESEVFVVDNDSSDGTPQMVSQCYPQVQLVINTDNVGFARANNQAIRLSRGRYVLLLNPDTVILPDALTLLISFMDSHPGAGAAGPKLLNPDRTLQTSCYPIPTLSREFWRLFHLDRIWNYGGYPMARWDSDQARAVEVIQGACMLIRREAFDKIGFLDEDYFIYTEEVDLCFRLHQAGWEIFWVAQAEVIHYGEQSTRQLAAEMFLHLYRSKLLFFRKHYGELASSIYKIILATAALTRLVLAPIALMEHPDQRRKHLSLAENYRNLLLNIPSM